MALKLTREDFSHFFNVTVSDLPAPVTEAIDRGDFRYQTLTQQERDRVILGVLDRIDSGNLTKVGEHRKEIWEKGWEENLDEFSAKGFALESLIPRFMRLEPIVRLGQDYVRAENPRFEFHFHDVIRRWLYCTFMVNCASVYEFGCGSAYNLVAISELAPKIKLVGLDWTDSAVKLTNLIGQNHNIPLTGRHFDFFHPDNGLDIGSNDAALTVCALEQIGDRHEDFIQFLLAKKPRVCVHMEPLLDLYEPENLVDSLAIRFHTYRKYLSGFLPRLRMLEKEGRIEIIITQRIKFGSLYHEGYSFVAWRVR